MSPRSRVQGRRLGVHRFHLLLADRLFTPAIMRLPYALRHELFTTTLKILGQARKQVA